MSGEHLRVQFNKRWEFLNKVMAAQFFSMGLTPYQWNYNGGYSTSYVQANLDASAERRPRRNADHRI